MKEKRRLWKIWKNDGSKDDYVLAKKVAKRREFAAKKKVEKEKIKDIETDTYLLYSKTNEARKQKYCWRKMYSG